MAPARRKGAKKSSATASDCRRWNVGDLVLAKVKGFPAWPATVSHPEKWGYTTDRKKVFVLFFGTEQIAFCSPADIVAFTEEKKQSLANRQGRGSDFVRAVKEIIECYEKLNSGELDNADAVDSVDLSANSGFEDQVDSPWTINSQMKSPNSVTGNPKLVNAAEDDSIVAPRDESYIKKATADTVAPVKSLLQAKLGNEPIQRSRSSSQIQNFVGRRSDGVNKGGCNDGNISADAIQKKSIRRKHVRKSLNLYGCNDTNSSAFASNVSIEENGSEINAINSDACSLNEGSAIYSNLKLEQSDIVECSQYEVGLNKDLDREMKAVDGKKKKRKPNRMRKINNAGTQNTNQSLQNMSENPKERCFDQDGDEHLPLLKRARVRKANSSFTEVNVSPKLLAPCSENASHASKVKKDQSFGFSVDDESSLPPSKRIHRALKAMSANAAEQGACIESPPSIMTSSCVSTIKRCSYVALDNQGGNDLELKGSDSCGIDCSDTRVCSFSTCSNPMILKEDKSSFEEDKQLAKSQQHESGKDLILGARHQIGEDLNDSVVCAPAKIDSQVLMQEKLSSNLDVKYCQVGSNQDSPKAGESIRPVIHSNISDTSDHRGINLDPVAGSDESGKLLPIKGINIPQNLVGVCEDMKGTAGDCSKINDTHAVVEEVKFKGQQKDMISLSTSNGCSGGKGVLGIPASSSLTDGGVYLPQGSPPNTSVRNVSTSDSSNIHQNRRCSPYVLQKSILSGPVDGSKNGAVANQQSSSIDKSADAGHAALLYFEAMLGTLRRTKENISRATRIAIDCAKYGYATKVVESLVCSLESEPSLHRRVDLFFLVDSIAQCSRGSKGDVGAVYPSVVEAFLPRLLSAAAPPGNTAQDNRRQCLKVLRLWLERRILPESIIRQHIRELYSYSSSASAGVYSRRSLRTERSLDDPIREMEGMLVDEYGSNSSFQLSGFRMPCMLEDGASDSDGENFNAVTPQHGSEVQAVSHAFEKHRHVLEAVDGELEMEDVAPSFDVELNSSCNVDKKISLSFAPCLPQDVLSSSPHPPSFAPPPPPPPPPPSPPSTLQLMSNTSDQYRTAVDSKAFTDSQTVPGKTFHSVAQPLAAPRNSRPMDAVQFQIPECRDVQMQIPESTCSFNTYPVRPPENSRSTDGFTVHNKGYILRPPHRVPSDQFSFVNAENRPKLQREVPSSPSYSNRHHSVHNMKRGSFYNNHERNGMRCNTRIPYEERWNIRAAHEERWNTRAPHEERWNTRTPHEERWNTRVPHEERWNTRTPYSGVSGFYGCHPSESPRSPSRGWRFPTPSMNYRHSTPFRHHFDDAIPIAHRGPSFWRPRRTETSRY